MRTTRRRVSAGPHCSRERHTLATAGRAQARCLTPPVVDGDTVVLHWAFVFAAPGGGANLRLEELVLQTWRGDKLASERFFYDPRQMRPG